jgi:hypothetical protein
MRHLPRRSCRQAGHQHPGRVAFTAHPFAALPDETFGGELCGFLQQANLARFYRQDYRIGDDNYNVHLPFVYLEGNTPRKAIKPLHLDKPATTDIYRHGDAWVSTIRRLTALNRLPKEFLFTVRGPTGDLKCEAAAQEICSELEKNGTRTVQFADRVAIEQFARI